MILEGEVLFKRSLIFQYACPAIIFIVVIYKCQAWIWSKVFETGVSQATHSYIYIYKVSKDGDRSRGRPEGSLQIATTPRCKGGHYSFPWIALLYSWYVPYNAVKQGGIKYLFFSLWYDSTWDWILVSRGIGEHSTHLANGPLYIYIYIYIYVCVCVCVCLPFSLVGSFFICVCLYVCLCVCIVENDWRRS